MSKALFVTRHDISVFTAANGNVDNDKLLPRILIAQDIHIQNYLGTDLYNKIQADIVGSSLVDPYLSLLNDYIKPMLLHWSMVEYLLMLELILLMVVYIQRILKIAQH